MKNKLFFGLFMFVLCFMFISNVKAKTINETCFYSGQLWDESVNTSGTERGNQTFAVAIDYSCNTSNNKCTSKYAAGYTDKNGKSKSINFKNASNIFGNSSESKDSFYSNKKISCPSKIVVTGNTTNGVNMFYECPSGKAANGECLGNATQFSSTNVPSGDELADKVKNVTDLGHYNSNQAANTPATDPNNNENSTDNSKYIDSIRNRANSDIKDNTNNKDNFKDLNSGNSCTSLLGKGDKSIAPLLKNVFFVICVIGIVIAIFSVSGDFIKAITSGENDAISVAFKNAKTRIIATIILLLLPVIINFIVDVINDNVIVITDNENNKTEVKIGSVSNCKIVD